MVKNKCENCWNNAGGFCTLNTKSEKDMEKASFQQCDGWKEIPPQAIKKKKSQEELEEEKSQRELRLLAKIDVGSKFNRFIKKGGGFSFRTGEYIGVADGDEGEKEAQF